MVEAFYVRLHGEVRGPFSRDDLYEEMQHDRFGSIHEVSVDQKQWRPATDLMCDLGRRKPHRPAPPNAKSVAGTKPFVTIPASHSSLQTPEPSSPMATPCWQWTVGGLATGEQTSLTKLIDRIQAGQIRPHEFVRRGTDAEWQRADDVPELDGAWDTSQLRLWSCTSGVLGAAALMISLPASTWLVYRWTFANGHIGAGPWSGVVAGAIIAAAGAAGGQLGYNAWTEAEAPRSRSLRWLGIGLVGGYAVLISSFVLTAAYSLTVWLRQSTW